MKVLGLAAVAATAVAISSPRHALAAPACEVLMCMSGISGNGVALPDCHPAIGTYFSIIRYNIHGFDAGHTYAARLAFLNTCEGADLNQQWVQAIQAEWGVVPFAP